MPLSESDQKLVKRLREKYGKKLRSFSTKHPVWITCYPDGEKRGIVSFLQNGQKVKMSDIPTCVCYQQHIYICKHNCIRSYPCRRYEAKEWACRDLRCSERPVCITLSDEKQRKRCKKKKMFKERKALIKTYDKYLLLFQIWRGLKTSPRKTLRYLEKNGKIQRSKT